MNKNVGFAMCGSFCTISRALEQMANLKKLGYNVIPIMSEIVWSTDTRFGRAEDLIAETEAVCENKIIHTICDAEPVGPKKTLDILVIAPCTGNTLGKLANGITDTSVTMAAKSHLRNGRPLLINISTNDGLGAAAKNIGQLMNYRNIYFVPLRQDDSVKKPRSLVADFTKIPESIEKALDGVQLQPMLI